MLKNPPSHNGRLPGQSEAPPPVKAGKKSKKKQVPFVDRNSVFSAFTPAEWSAWQSYIDRLPNCPGYMAVMEIVRQSHELARSITEVFESHGAGTRSILSRFAEDFGRTDIFDALVALNVNLNHASALIDCSLPDCRP